MKRTIRIPIKITTKVTTTRPVTKVTRSGQLYCNNCGTMNHVNAGLENPICGRCGWRLA